MAFRIVQKRTIKWPVTVSIPQDGGKVTKSTFHGEFEVQNQDELSARVSGGEDLLEIVLVGWKGVTGDDDQELPYTDEEKKRLLQIPYVRTAVMGAYVELQQGREAARKN